MKNTVNIFEELNKMKNLIKIKAGTVISEQPLVRGTSAEPVSDPRINLSQFGLTLPNRTFFCIVNNRTRIGGSAVTPQGDNKVTFVLGEYTWEFETPNFPKLGIWSQKKGILTTHQGTWVCDGTTDYKVMDATNKKTYSSKTGSWAVTQQPESDNSTESSVKQTGPTPTQRFKTTAKSLGVENPQMDVATLQKILDTLNASSGAVTESKKTVNEELNTMKYLLGYQRGRVISEQDTATTATPQDLIKQIQTVLLTKYNAELGNYGPNKDGVDGKWGNISQTALETALKTAAETKQKADELSQRRAAETQQTATQDAAIQQAVDQGNQNIKSDNLQLQLQPANTQGVQTPDLYTTLVNNKTLRTRNNGNIVYRGDDLTSAQRQELETKLQTMGYYLSTDQRDKTYGDKLVFKKNQ